MQILILKTFKFISDIIDLLIIIDPRLCVKELVTN